MNKDLTILLEIFERIGMSITDFCKQTGIDRNRFYSWKKERGNPKANDSELIRKWIFDNTDKAPEIDIMLHKIDRDRLDKVLQVVKSVDIKFMPKKISEVTGFSKGHVSNILNGNVAMTENFYETFLKHFDTDRAMTNNQDKPLNKSDWAQDDSHVVSLNTLIESNKMLVETNRDLTDMLKQSYSNKVSSNSDQHISGTLLPYLQQIALGGAGRFWKDENVGIVELNKILLGQVKAEVKLGK